MDRCALRLDSGPCAVAPRVVCCAFVLLQFCERVSGFSVRTLSERRRVCTTLSKRKHHCERKHSHICKCTRTQSDTHACKRIFDVHAHVPPPRLIHTRHVDMRRTYVLIYRHTYSSAKQRAYACPYVNVYTALGAQFSLLPKPTLLVAFPHPDLEFPL